MTKTFSVSSSEDNFVIPDGIVVSSDAFSNHSTRWAVSKTTLRGGVQEGVEVISVDNGAMSIRILPTRGMSILDAHVGETRLGWDSPIQQVVHPRYVNLEAQGGLGWLDGFNELMVRCGVSFAGAPGDDGGQFLTLHGRIGNLPATKVEVTIEEGASPRIRVRGLVEEKRFKFGVFELWTEISTELGSHSFQINDELTNLSEYEQEYQLIYHTNFGRPFLEAGAQFIAPIEQVTPLNDYAAKDLKTYQEYLGPTAGYGEQVYCLSMRTDDSGGTTTALQNQKGDLGVALRYDARSLPFFNLWKNTDTETDGYVTGLEPATGFPFNRSVEREHGRVPKLAHGETVSFRLSLEYLDSQQQASEIRKEIQELGRQ